jgi:hypothetical protein
MSQKLRNKKLKDIFKEDKELLKSGKLKFAFKWSLIGFLIIWILHFLGGVITTFAHFLVGLFIVAVIPNIVLILI